MSEHVDEPTIPEQISELEERVAGLETRITEAIASEVAKTVPPIAVEAVRGALEPYVEKIGELTDRFAKVADRGEQGIDAWAHAKIDALTNGVSRAIGIHIPMPTRPGEIVSGSVTVPGAETADQLSHG